MQDPKLRELVDEVSRCETNYNLADSLNIDYLAERLRIAKNNLSDYIKQVKRRKVN